jgi:hypothetical protein
MCSLPLEIIRRIIDYLDSGGDIRGRGTNMTSLSVALTSHTFNELQKSCLARVYQRRIHQGTVHIDSNPNLNNGVEQVGHFTLKDEVVLPSGPLRVGEVIVWRDLNEAFDCVTSNLENWSFWIGIRAIFLDFTEGYVNGTFFAPAAGRPHYYKKAHWVFIHLADILRYLQFQYSSHRLHWLRIRILDRNAILSMDVAGMFGLSQVSALPHLHFHPAEPGKAISDYIDLGVRKHLQRRTRWSMPHTWGLARFEGPYPQIDCKAQARRNHNSREEGEQLQRILRTRYGQMFRL